MARRRRLVLGLMAATATFVVDLVVKAWASSSLSGSGLRLTSLLSLRLSHNSGMAFGLGSGLPSWSIALVVAAVTVGVAVMVFRSHFNPVAAGLILGGAIANLIDQLGDGSVVDFIDLGWWPSFNLADSAIVIGVGILMIESFRTPQTDGIAPMSSGQSIQGADRRREGSTPK